MRRFAAFLLRLLGLAPRDGLTPAGRLPPSEMYPLGTGSVQARFITLRSGPRVRVAECGPQDGKPLLLIHGWAGSIYGFRKNMPTLGAAGYRTIAVDLLGHGLSDKPLDVARYTWTALIAQIEEIMEALDLESATLIGQSMGGHLALSFALEKPSRATAVAVVNATGFGYISGIRVVQLLAGMPPALHLPITTRRFMVKLVLRAIYGRLGDFSERDVDEYWAPSQFPEWGRVLVTLLRIVPWGRVPPGEFGEVLQPTLVIVSSDPLVRTGDEAALQSRVPPRSTIVRVDGGGHLVNEEAPEPVNDALLSFLSEL